MDIRKWIKKNTAEESNTSDSITVVKASTSNASSILPDSLPLPAPLSLPDKQLSASTLRPVGGPQVPGDLGTTQPTQVFLKTYPTRLYSGVKQSFCSSWFAARKWLEYSCEKDSIFCYACRNFGSNKNSTDAFTTTGYNNWRHALVRGKGLGRHESSKEAHEVSGIVEGEACKECDWYRDFHTCKYSTTGKEPHLCSSYC
ncbi:hypothetical protein N1851_004849 [Merluccius polli]|uniref:TTF-type domain-containing protein n=1 Tax=Merluccius polli TaxID=89951 RepID=A0AA47N6T8_MERPO|nr:hypothetical protein N1851_004849 [Merluccius polli]